MAVRCLTNSFVLTLILLEAASPVAHSAEFIPLGDLDGGLRFSQATGISADGSVVVGTSDSQQFGRVAFRWTRETGMVGLGSLVESGNWGTGVSADGSVVVGYTGGSEAGRNAAQPFRWTETEGMVGLGHRVPQEANRARAVSGDGMVIVGDGGTSAPGHSGEAFVWSERRGMRGIGGLPPLPDNGGKGFLSAANDVSDDGLVVVGDAGDAREAFRWTQSEGMTGLGFLPGGEDESIANAISPDGKVIVGQSTSANTTRFNGFWEAYRWTKADGMIGLGDLPGGRFMSVALGVSANGEVVVGRSNTGDDSVGITPAFIWDETNGMRSVQEILINRGIDLTGWRLREATDVSADGTVIVGRGRNPSGQEEAWLADLSMLGDFDNSFELDVADIELLSSAIRDQADESRFDLNDDGSLTQADVEFWIHELKNTWFGDANLDGEFNSGDLVAVFEAGHYEIGEVGNSTWATGDWNGDGEFNTNDLVRAFKDGGYEQGPRTAVASVPEPSSIMLLFVGILGTLQLRRRS